MKPVIWLSAVLYVLILAGLAARDAMLLALALPLLLYLGAGLFFSPVEVRLTAARQLSTERALPGEALEVRLTITNQGSHIENLLVEDQLPENLTVTAGSASLLTALPPDESVELCYTLQAPRGVYRFRHARVTLADHLGVRPKTLEVAAPGHIFIQPRVQRIGRIHIRPRGTRVYAGFIPARRGGPGVEFFGVRAYQHGDPLRWINWRASARQRQGWFVNQFEQERVADIGLILDTRLRSEVRLGAQSLFEQGVSAAAALSDRFLNDGNRVGLLLYGKQLDWTLPGYGKIQRERILQSLARAQPGASQVFEKMENLPRRLLPVNSQIILISPLHEDDLPVLIHLRARGYAVLVVSPDPIAFELAGQQNLTAERQLATRLARIERRLLLQKLRQAGVQVLDWDLHTPLDAALHTSLSRAIPQLHPAESRR